MTGNASMQRLKLDLTMCPRLIPYFGAKAFTLMYPSPQHDALIEPFAGGASYALRYPDRKVILVEKSIAVALLDRCLCVRDPKPAARQRCG
jgi:hypothetical protein